MVLLAPGAAPDGSARDLVETQPERGSATRAGRIGVMLHGIPVFHAVSVKFRTDIELLGAVARGSAPRQRHGDPERLRQVERREVLVGGFIENSPPGGLMPQGRVRNAWGSRSCLPTRRRQPTFGRLRPNVPERAAPGHDGAGSTGGPACRAGAWEPRVSKRDLVSGGRARRAARRLRRASGCRPVRCREGREDLIQPAGGDESRIVRAGEKRRSRCRGRWRSVSRRLRALPRGRRMNTDRLR
jgi:hypothetical protein